MKRQNVELEAFAVTLREDLIGGASEEGSVGEDGDVDLRTEVLPTAAARQSELK